MPPMQLYDQDGRPLQVGERIGAGGEAEIFSLPDFPGLCVKLYLKGRNIARQEEKIRVMINHAPVDPMASAEGRVSIAWPIKALFSESRCRDFRGFTMPLIDRASSWESQNFYNSAERSNRSIQGLTWRHMLNAATNFISAVAAVHAKGHCIGDLQHRNVLVGHDTLVTLIDSDSFQIVDPRTGKVFFTPCGLPECLAPELQGSGVNLKCDRSLADLFSLQLMVFKFLMNGVQPYASAGNSSAEASSTEQKIRRGIFVFDGKIRGLKPPAWAPEYQLIPPSIRDGFHRCFVDGHSDPNRRPTAVELLGIFTREMAKPMQTCKKTSTHVYASHLTSCPWCAHRSRTGTDLFPEVVAGRQTRLAPISTSAGRGRITGGRLQTIPALTLIPAEIRLQNVECGTRVERKIEIINDGGGSLDGTISTHRSWPRLSKTAIDPKQTRQVVSVSIDTAQFKPGDRVSTRIDFSTNAGDVSVPVVVSLRVPDGARQWFNRGTLGVGALCGGVFGSLLYRHAAGTGDFAGASQFLALTTLFSGAIGAAILGFRGGRFKNILVKSARSLLWLLAGIFCAYFVSTIGTLGMRPGSNFAVFWALLIGWWITKVAVDLNLVHYCHRRAVCVLGVVSLFLAAALANTSPPVPQPRLTRSVPQSNAQAGYAYLKR